MNIKKRFPVYPIFLTVFLICCSNAYSLGSDNNTSTVNLNRYALITISTGYRTDTLDWNTAGFNNNPNILSELEYEDIKIYQTALNIKSVLNNFVVNLYYNYGVITDGNGYDSDYDGDNRTLIFSKSSSTIEDDNVCDFSLAAGYQFSNKSNNFIITPAIGFSRHDQNICVTNGIQTVETENITPPLGPFSGLNSTYESSWKSFWIGSAISFIINKNFTLSADYKYHFADYEAVADWNLREVFSHPVSFIHSADANGHESSFILEYCFSNNWVVATEYKYHTWSTKQGTSTTFFNDGAQGTTILNEVNWTSKSFNLIFGYRF